MALTRHTSAPEEPAPPAHRLGRRWVGYAAAGLVAAWVVPVATQAGGVSWLLPVVIWGVTASLLRNGQRISDRLVFAAALLAGATCLAGLVMSRWPWGMSPVPVAGTALTTLVLLAVLLRRRPTLPRPVTADLLPLLAGGLAAVVIVLPYWGKPFVDRLALNLTGEDLARHFSLYDAVAAVDSYAFLDRAGTDPYLLPGMQIYPQGSHFLYALLDSFVRSGAPATDPTNSWDHFVGFHIAGYVGFAIAVSWAARWVAGGTLSGWPKVAVTSFVTAALGFSELIAMYVRGFASEIAGLALFAVLVAVLARPPRHTREAIITIAALVVGVGWIYFFLLPFAGALCVAALIGYRHRVRRHWVTAALLTPAATGLAVIPFLVMYAERTSPLADLLPGGPIDGVDRGLTVAIAALVLAGLATVPRSPVLRMVAVQLVLVAVIAIGLGVYQIASVGNLSYYFDKAVHALFVTGLVGLAGVGPLLARYRRSSPASRAAPPRRAWQVATAALVVFGVFASFGAIPLQRPRSEHLEPIRNVSWGIAYAAGVLQDPAMADVITAVLRRYPNPDGRVTQVLYRNGDATYLCSLFVSVLHRDYGTLARSVTPGRPLFADDDSGIVLPMVDRPRRLVVVNNRRLAAQLAGTLASYPDQDVEMVSITVRTRPIPTE